MTTQPLTSAKHMPTLAVMLVVLALAAGPAQAEGPTCNLLGGQGELNACAADNFKAADARLDEVYARAVTKAQGWDAELDPDQKGAEKSLREAQRAWITYRDETCNAESYRFYRGSVRPMFRLSCKTRVTDVRTEELREMVEINPMTGNAD